MIPVVFREVVLLIPKAVVAVVAVPVRLPMKVPAVTMPVVLMLTEVVRPRAFVAVVAVPVRFPTNPPVAVIIPLVLTDAVAVKPVAFPVTFPVTLPVRLPTNVVAVITPDTTVSVKLPMPADILVAVRMPTVLMLTLVENPRAVVALVAVPVRLPTNPPVAVIIPEVLTDAVVVSPVAFPVNPLVAEIVVAVMIPVCPLIIMPEPTLISFVLPSIATVP